jgi:hypothetical protein
MGYAVLGILLNNIVFITLKVSCHPDATPDLPFIANTYFLSTLPAIMPFLFLPLGRCQKMYCFLFFNDLPATWAASNCHLLLPSACHLMLPAATSCHLL